MSYAREIRHTCRVYVGGLRPETQIQDIKHLFRHYARRFDVLLKRGFAFLVRYNRTELGNLR